MHRVSFGIFRAGFLIAASLGALLLTGTCQAEIVKVGATLPIPVEESIVMNCPSCVLANLGGSNGASDIAPVDGAIIRWRINQAGSFSGRGGDPSFRLRVLTPEGQGYADAGTSDPVSPLGWNAVETFSAHLPVKAGQVIGLELQNENSNLLFGESPTSAPTLLEQNIAAGSTYAQPSWWPEAWWGREAVWPFSAEILPPPAITAVSANHGSLAGGTAVTIAGENFSEVSSVSFGSTETSYAVYTESEISATVPPGLAATSVPVSVATVAGRAEAAAAYAYEATPAIGAPAADCVVPNLKDRRLNAVRRMLSRDRCRLGGVRRRRHATTRTGRVKRQSPLPGTSLPAGSMVEVALGL